MPQLILLAVVGAVAYAGYKRFTKQAEKVTARIRRQQEEARSGTQGTLVKDPETGVYVVSKD